MTKRLLGSEHPYVATSLNNLAALYESQGKNSLALDYLKQGLEIEEQNLDYNLVAGSEQQKKDYIRTISGTTDAIVSLHLKKVPNNERAARLALTTILRRKGRILDILTQNQQILRQRLDTQSQTLLDELNTSRTQLANLIYNRPPNLSGDEYKDRIATLSKKARKLEERISRRSSEFRTVNQTVTLEAIQKQIPVNAALVELVQYQPFNPTAPAGKRFGNPHYAAYIVPTNIAKYRHAGH